MEREEELALYRDVAAGRTVVASMRKGGHERLIRWAKQNSVFVRIDRRTKYGNPFVMRHEGERDAVIAQYAEHCWPDLDGLHGKVLGCWCAPLPCHGDVLAARCNTTD